MTPTYIAGKTLGKMTPAVRALFERLWNDSVERRAKHNIRWSVERLQQEHENLADYVAKLADYVAQGESPAFAISTSTRPPLGTYTHTPTATDLENLK